MNTSNTYEWRPKLPTIWRPDDCDDVVWFRTESVSDTRNDVQEQHHNCITKPRANAKTP